MEKKQQMALAAVGAVVALIYLMRKQPQASGGLPAAMSSAASGSTKPAPIIVTVGSTKPQAVADSGAVANPAPVNVPPPQPAGSGSAGQFVIGGGASSNPTKPGSGYFGSGGTEINDPTAVGRLDSIKTYVNTLDWSDANKASSAAALANAAQQYGVGYREIAIATGYRESDVDKLFKDNGQAVGRF